MSFATQLFECRKRSGLTQKQLSAAIEVSTSSISMWECGTVNIKAEQLEKVADYFHVTADLLLDRNTREEDKLEKDILLFNSIYKKSDPAKRKNIMTLFSIAFSSDFEPRVTVDG